MLVHLVSHPCGDLWMLVHLVSRTAACHLGRDLRTLGHRPMTLREWAATQMWPFLVAAITRYWPN
jgi:hypothetical protein